MKRTKRFSHSLKQTTNNPKTRPIFKNFSTLLFSLVIMLHEGAQQVEQQTNLRRIRVHGRARLEIRDSNFKGIKSLLHLSRVENNQTLLKANYETDRIKQQQRGGRKWVYLIWKGVSLSQKISPNEVADCSCRHRKSHCEPEQPSSQHFLGTKTRVVREYYFQYFYLEISLIKLRTNKKKLIQKFFN